MFEFASSEAKLQVKSSSLFMDRRVAVGVVISKELKSRYTQVEFGEQGTRTLVRKMREIFELYQVI